MAIKNWHFGNTLQLIWIPLGLGLQIWIGGGKGLVFNIIVIVMLIINSNKITKLTKD